MVKSSGQICHSGAAVRQPSLVRWVWPGPFCPFCQLFGWVSWRLCGQMRPSPAHSGLGGVQPLAASRPEVWADSPAFQTCSLGLWSNMPGSGPIWRSFRAARGPIFAVTALPLRAGGCVRTPWWSNISQGRGQASQEV